MVDKMASNQPTTSAGTGVAQEYIVRVQRDPHKKYCIMKFNASSNVDFTKCGSAKIERENNFREFKLSHDMDTAPKFGAGSEYGKDQREEARRKKYGIHRKKYNVENQPWHLKIGDGKQARRFKGTKEGTVTENASYFIFTQCPDGAFEATPVEEFFNFTPVAKFKSLNSEEAEEEFSKRDKTLNYFSIMVKKRIKNDDTGDAELDEEEKKLKKKSKSKKDFMLTEMEDWAEMSEEEEGGADSDKERPDSEEEAEKKKKKKSAKGKADSKKSKKRNTNSDDEALEESDDMDEGEEVDYMTDSDSDDDEMYADKDREQTEKYQEKGVEDEEGLKNSDDDDDDEEKKDKEDNEEEEEEDSKTGKDSKKDTNAGSDSGSSSSGSDTDDSDPEKETTFASALFMQKKKDKDKEKEKDQEKKKPPSRRPSNESEASAGASNSASNSRSATPTGEAGKKRKADSDLASLKKPKVDLAALSSAASDGITEDVVRKYLMRKPMTTKDLVQKFKNTRLNKQQLVNTIASLLKRIGPESTRIKDKLYLYLKKPQ